MNKKWLAGHSVKPTLSFEALLRVTVQTVNNAITYCLSSLLDQGGSQEYNKNQTNPQNCTMVRSRECKKALTTQAEKKGQRLISNNSVLGQTKYRSTSVLCFQKSLVADTCGKNKRSWTR